MSLIEEVEEIARPIAVAMNAYIVDVAVRGNAGQKVLELFLDTDSGITTEQCAEISRELSRALDATDLVRGRYHLVVSSPGLDRPLRFPRQYAKNIGRRFFVRVNEGDHINTIEGTLVGMNAEGIVLELQEADRRIVTFEEIVEARVRAPW